MKNPTAAEARYLRGLETAGKRVREDCELCRRVLALGWAKVDDDYLVITESGRRAWRKVYAAADKPRV